jgi:hypothetical protein
MAFKPWGFIKSGATRSLAVSRDLAANMIGTTCVNRSVKAH